MTNPQHPDAPVQFDLTTFRKFIATCSTDVNELYCSEQEFLNEMLDSCLQSIEAANVERDTNVPNEQQIAAIKLLEKYIEKYGEIEGIVAWKNKQYK